MGKTMAIGLIMTRIDLLVVSAIMQAKRDLNAVTVPTTAIQVRLGIRIPERTLRWRLSQMEQARMVKRPRGPKSGWTVSRPVRRGLWSARSLRSAA